MKVIVTRNAILNALKDCSRVADPKNALDFLKNVYCYVEGEELVMCASNSEMYLVERVKLESVEGEQKKFMMDPKKAIDSLSNIAEQPLTFTVEDSKIVVKYHKGKFQMALEEVGDFVAMPEVSNPVSFMVPRTDLVLGFNSTIPFCSHDNLRPAMCGILIDVIGKESANFVATDGHRLAKLSSAFYCDKEMKVIVPKSAASVLTALTSKMSNETINGEIGTNNIKFSYGNTQFITRTVDSKYPNYNAVIPAETDKSIHVVLNKEDIKNATKRVSVMASEGAMLVEIKVEPGKVILHSEDIEFQTKGEEEIAVEYAGRSERVGVKATYFIDAINVYPDNDIDIRIDDESRPIVIASHSMTILLMPLMINN